MPPGGEIEISDRSTRRRYQHRVRRWVLDIVEHIGAILPAPPALSHLLQYHWKLRIGKESKLALRFSKWLISEMRSQLVAKVGR